MPRSTGAAFSSARRSAISTVACSISRRRRVVHMPVLEADQLAVARQLVDQPVGLLWAAGAGGKLVGLGAQLALVDHRALAGHLFEQLGAKVDAAPGWRSSARSNSCSARSALKPVLLPHRPPGLVDVDPIGGALGAAGGDRQRAQLAGPWLAAVALAEERGRRGRRLRSERTSGSPAPRGRRGSRSSVRCGRCGARSAGPARAGWRPARPGTRRRSRGRSGRAGAIRSRRACRRCARRRRGRGGSAAGGRGSPPASWSWARRLVVWTNSAASRLLARSKRTTPPLLRLTRATSRSVRSSALATARRWAASIWARR